MKQAALDKLQTRLCPRESAGSLSDGQSKKEILYGGQHLIRRILRKILLRRITLVVLSTLFAFALAEAVVRILVPQAGWRQFEDTSLGWSGKEYQALDSRAVPKPDNAVRIVTLGDSFLAGAGIYRYEQRFTEVAKERLPFEADVHVLASAGWGTDQQLLAFLQKGAPLKPDLVILAFCANNDLSDNLSNGWPPNKLKPYFVLHDSGRLELFAHNGEPIENATRYLNYRKRAWIFQSYFLDLLRYMVLGRPTRSHQEISPSVDPRYQKFHHLPEHTEEILSLQPELSWSPQAWPTRISAYVHEDFETNTYQWKLLEALMVRFKSETEKSGARFLVMLLPVSLKPHDLRFAVGGDLVNEFRTPQGSFTFRASEPRDRLQAICKRQGIHFFDPTGDFIQQI
ncbi:SGNH/GDSL hydrolase family protein, partial [Acidobacteriota bacterium]